LTLNAPSKNLTAVQTPKNDSSKVQQSKVEAPAAKNLTMAQQIPQNQSSNAQKSIVSTPSPKN